MRFFRRRAERPAQDRPNHTRIAVMEHDLLGIKPEPGTAAALAISLRQVGTCLTHQPVDATQLADPRPTGICSRCGKCMVQDESGSWRIA